MKGRGLPFWWTTGFLLLILIMLSTDRYWLQLELERTANLAEQRLGVYQTSLQATIDRHAYLPQILAADPRIVSALASTEAEESTITSTLLARINAQAGSDEIYLMDTTGDTLWSSNYRSPTSFVGNNYAFRPYFITALDGGAGFYFAVGATSGKPGLFLSAAVVDELDSVVGVIVVKIDLGPLEDSWLKSGDAVWVTDNEGIVFLSSSEQWHYVATRPLSEEHQQRLSETRQYGSEPVQLLEVVDDSQGGRWSTLDLGDSDVHVLFGTPVLDYPWTMNLRVPLADIHQRVLFVQALVILICVVLVGSVLFSRERVRRTRAQRAVVRLIEEREQHQRAIIQNTDVGVFNLDESFQYLFVNEKARQLFGLSPKGNPWSLSDLITPWHPESTSPYQAQGIRTDGSQFPIVVTNNLIKVGQDNEYILTVQDISELTQAQEALRHANSVLEQRVEERTQDLKHAQAALAQNQKLAALGRMSSALAHEINQPITALSNYIASSRLLLERGKTKQVGDNLGRIESLVDRLSRISRQLRIFAGRRNSGSADVSLKQPVLYALDLLKPRLEEGAIRWRFDIVNDAIVQANTMFLEQIMVNLLSNAIDVLQGQPDAEVVISLQPVNYDASKVELILTDNGPGMDKEQTAHIFEPFYTTKKTGDGLGLGLAISYSLASDMGAYLTVNSEVGQGASFTLRFDNVQWVKDENL